MSACAILLAAGLALAATVLALDRWIDATVLPPLAPPPRPSSSTATARSSPPTPSPTAAGACRSTLAAVDRGYLAQLTRLRGPPLPPPPRRRPPRPRPRRPPARSPPAASSPAARPSPCRSPASSRTARPAPSAGKLRQMRVALALERRLDKDAILGLYLTLAPYGGNLEGVRAASLAWLGKEPRRLTPAEAALLVALPQSPETRRPDRAPDAARAARDRVLARAAAAGVLAPEEAAAARTEPVPDRPPPLPGPRAPPRRPPRRRRPGRGRRSRPPSTPRSRPASRRSSPSARATLGPGISAALIVADHRTGAVLARVGAADRLDPARGGFVDMSRAVRSPGLDAEAPRSTASPSRPGLAHPETIVEDRPMRFGS